MLEPCIIQWNALLNLSFFLALPRQRDLGNTCTALFDLPESGVQHHSQPFAAISIGSPLPVILMTFVPWDWYRAFVDWFLLHTTCNLVRRCHAWWSLAGLLLTYGNPAGLSPQDIFMIICFWLLTPLDRTSSSFGGK